MTTNDPPAAPQPATDDEPMPGTYWEAAVLRRFVAGSGNVDLDTVRQQVGAMLAQLTGAASAPPADDDAERESESARARTAPQSATPGQLDMRRERAILRWAADRLDYQAWADPTGQWSAPQAEAGRAQKRLMLERLRRWADELDAAPGDAEVSAMYTGIQAVGVLRQAGYPEIADWVAGLAGRAAAPGVYQLPDKPLPDVTELWDQSGDRWVRKQWPVHPDGSPAEPGTSWMWERNGLGERQRWPGLLAYGQLSTTPPAGTEGERREEEVDDAATE